LRGLNQIFMNAAHLHLLLNHLPVVGTLFALLLLLFGIARQNNEIKKAAFWFFVLAALCAIPAYLTGAPAEKLIKEIPGVTENAIDRHEDFAKIALVLDLAVGALALFGLIICRAKVVPPWLVLLVLVLSLAAGGALAWTANLGGQIRHTEIQSDAAPAVSATEKKHD
jgi:uncharacterized membrane protein